MRCPLCAAATSRCVYSVAAAPVTCTSIYRTAADARAVPVGDIRLAVCEICGFAFNEAFDVAIAKLGAHYESSQSASARFTRFADALASEWVERYQLQGRNVIEVGCGSGDFLRALRRAGIAQGIGIDPLALPQAGDAAALDWRIEEFGPGHFAIEADALVCRHTLEHVPDVRGLLSSVRQWASLRPGRIVLFEVPASECVHSQGAFWDVYYEHCNYFTAQTLRHALTSAGFAVLRLARVYDDQYLTIEARPAELRFQPEGEPAEVDAWRAFGQDANAAICRCRDGFDAIGRDGGATAIWQGAAKTVAVLSACGELASVTCAIDLSPARQGMFLPGSGLAVLDPAYLLRLAPNHVVLMNPVYVNEVQATLDVLGVGARLHTINDLLAGHVGRDDHIAEVS